jgi:hypothetical protein
MIRKTNIINPKVVGGNGATGSNWALGCVLLIVLAAIPPVTGGTGGTAGLASAGNEAALAGAGNTPAGPPAALKAEAAAAVENASVGESRYVSARDRAYDRLNSSLTSYRDPVRVDSQDAFTDDAVAVQALTKLADSEANVTALRASRYVAVADNRTAHQAIVDARKALNASEDQLDNRGKRRSAEAHTRNAERQFDRAQRLLERANDSEGRRAIRQYARAIRTLRTGWQQAQVTLRMLDEETSPSVTIVNRADPIRNGSGSVNRTVGVAITDVRPWTLDNITVAVNGDQRLNQSLEGLRADPGEESYLRIPVTLESRTAEITVRVTDERFGW